MMLHERDERIVALEFFISIKNLGIQYLHVPSYVITLNHKPQI